MILYKLFLSKMIIIFFSDIITEVSSLKEADVKLEKKKTLKTWCREFWFLCTALLHILIYSSFKFQSQ